MFSATEDDEFFTPTTSTNLASLFGQNISSSNNEDTDLTYTAPKQRKPQNEILNKEREKVTTSVICAKPVYLYKLTDDLYKLIGKYALALIGDINHATEIILYKDKQNILTRAKFVNFQFLLQKDNFLSFTDDNKQKWSMHFEKLTDFEDFACILKIRNISIKECLVKSSKDLHDSKTDLNTNLDHVESLYPKNSLNIDPESSDSSSSQVRANILSRMAKMGHSILPNPVLGNLRSDSETEDSDINKKVPRKPKRHHANGKDLPVKSQSFCNDDESQICKSTSNTHLSSTSNSNIKQHTVLNNRQNPIMNDITQTVQTFPMLINSGTPVYDNLNMYFLENRTHNSEVRMNLSLITSKLDNVLGEISKIEMPSNTDKLENKFLKSVVIDMETELKNKDQEIEKLKETNELLKKSLNESSSLRDKIILLELKEVELNKIIENQNLQLKDLKAFYEENKDNPNLQTAISHLNDKINNLNLKLKDFEHYYHKNETLKNNRKELNDSKIISFSENTKQLMNAMFLNIFCLFENCNDGSNEEIKRKLAVHMKHTTFDIIKDFKNQLKDDSENNDSLYDYVLHKNEEGMTNVETVAPPVPS